MKTNSSYAIHRLRKKLNNLAIYCISYFKLHYVIYILKLKILLLIIKNIYVEMRLDTSEKVTCMLIQFHQKGLLLVDLSDEIIEIRSSFICYDNLMQDIFGVKRYVLMCLK